MAYRQSGVFLLKRHGKGVEHYGVGIAGWWTSRFGSFSPIVVHLLPSGVTVSAWDGSWQAVGQVADERAAWRRLQEVRAASYDLMGRNCEQFARYVVTGRSESRQLQGVAVVAFVLGLCMLAKN